VTFFRRKVSLWPKKNPPGWSGWKDGFSSLKLRLRSRILAVFGVSGLLCYNIIVARELPCWFSWLHWSLLTLFMRVVLHGSPYGVHKNTCCNYGNIFVRSRQYILSVQKFFSILLNTPNPFIWLEGHFRPIFLEGITKIEPVLIHSSQFWYISMALWWSTLVSHVFIEDMHLVDSPPHHCTTNSTQISVWSSKFCRNYLLFYSKTSFILLDFCVF